MAGLHYAFPNLADCGRYQHVIAITPAPRAVRGLPRIALLNPEAQVDGQELEAKAGHFEDAKSVLAGLHHEYLQIRAIDRLAGVPCRK